MGWEEKSEDFDTDIDVNAEAMRSLLTEDIGEKIVEIGRQTNRSGTGGFREEREVLVSVLWKIRSMWILDLLRGIHSVMGKSVRIKWREEGHRWSGRTNGSSKSENCGLRKEGFSSSSYYSGEFPVEARRRDVSESVKEDKKYVESGSLERNSRCECGAVKTKLREESRGWLGEKEALQGVSIVVMAATRTQVFAVLCVIALPVVSFAYIITVLSTKPEECSTGSEFMGVYTHSPCPAQISDAGLLGTFQGIMIVTFLSLGVGMVSITSPLYISKASPFRIRGALGSTNGLFFAVGQLLSYHFNYAFANQEPRTTWHYMIAVAGLPALVQFILMSSLPESPMWLYGKDRKEDAVEVLKKIYPSHEVEQEVDALRLSFKTEIAHEEDSGGILSKIRNLWCIPVVRKGLVAGIGLQVVQQFVGINTIMHCISNIIEMAGFDSTKHTSDITFQKFSLIIPYAYTNVFGVIVSIANAERYGRKKLLLDSIYGIIGSLFGLTFMFIISPDNFPAVSRFETTTHFRNNTCLTYITAPDAASWDCLTCVRAYSGCGFCADKGDVWKTSLFWGTPYMDHPTLPKKRICTVGIFAARVVRYLVLSRAGNHLMDRELRDIPNEMSFLSLTKAQGPPNAIPLVSLVSCLLVIGFIKLFVPETTKGLLSEEVEMMSQNSNVNLEEAEELKVRFLPV
ncbi:General substrate transporter [Macleaya cordata]|uniref:General substrate transporter n=1 Tax=Macleaya cordata TaxID=56857 RepID=A0A200QH13_MACCD|nr:General substrate transporter [Macleaya cordata]